MKTKTSPPEQRSGKGGGKFLPALCNILGTLILLAVIVTFLPLTVPRYLGYEIYNVVSGSMAPEIPVGSVIYVESVEPESVAEGDIIAFRGGESVITHRVVENRFVMGEYVTKGDANAAEDMNSVPYADLIGRVVYHFPAVGELMALYTGTVGKVYVLIFAACGVMFNILAGRLRDRRRDALRRKLEADIHSAPAVPGQGAGGNAAGKKQPSRGRRVRRFLMVLLACIFLFCAAGAAAILTQYHKGDAMYESIAQRFTQAGAGETAPETAGMTPGKKTGGKAQARLAEPAPIQVDFQSLQAENPDVIGWIYCEDSVINYPVLKGEDNDYYLHRDFEKNYSVFGSIFQEAQNRPGFVDANNILYGHHMNNGSMFASLDQWADQAYYESHPVMWLLTPEGDYRIDLLAGYTTSAVSDTYRVFHEHGEEFSAYLADAVERSDFASSASADESGRYVVLSTCAYVFDNARYVLFGLLVPAASVGGVPLA